MRLLALVIILGSASGAFAAAQAASSVFPKVRYLCQGADDKDILVLEQVNPLINANGTAKDFFSEPSALSTKFEFQIQFYQPLNEPIKDLTFEELADKLVKTGEPYKGTGARLLNRVDFRGENGQRLDINFDTAKHFKTNSSYQKPGIVGSFSYQCNPREVFYDSVDEPVSAQEAYCMRETGTKDCGVNKAEVEVEN